MKNLIRRSIFVPIFLDFALILIVAILPFWQTGTNGFIEPIDTTFPISPINFFQNRLWVWQENHPFFGFDGSQDLPFIPVLGVFALAKSVTGLPAELIQRVWNVLVFFLAGICMYFLAKILIKGNRLAWIVAAVFYIYNPATIAYMRGGGITYYLFVYATTPLFLRFLILGLGAKEHSNKYAALLSLASITQVLGFQLLATQMLVPLMYAVYYILSNWTLEKAKHALMFVLKAIGLILLINSWWIFPAIANFSQVYEQQAINISTRSILGWDYLSIYRLWLSSWPFPDYYSSLLGISVGVSLACLIFLPLIFPSRKDETYKYTIFFAISAIALAILFAGSAGPFGNLYQYAWSKMPLGAALLPTDTGKFSLTIALPFAILLGICASKLLGDRIYSFKRISAVNFRRLSKKGASRFRLIAVAALILLIFINAWPLLTGNLAGYISPVLVPKSYNELSDWLNNQPGDFRIFVIPSPYVQQQTKYTWAPYSMSDLLFQLPKPIVTDLPLSLLNGKDIVRFAQSSLFENNTANIGKILGLMNVKYILLRTDVDPEYHGSFDYGYLMQVLQNQKGINHVATFGNFTIYENSYFTQSAYVASKAVTVFGGYDSLLPLAQVDSLSLNSSVLLFPEDLTLGQRASLSESSDMWLVTNETTFESYAETAQMVTIPIVQLLQGMETDVYAPKSGEYIFAIPTKVIGGATCWNKYFDG